MKKRETKQITVRITVEAAQLLEDYCWENRRMKGSVIDEALAMWMAKNGGQKHD